MVRALVLGLLACVHEAAEDTASCEPEPVPVCSDGIAISARGERSLSAPIAVPHGPTRVVAGDLSGAGAPQIYVATSSTLTRLDGVGWTTAIDLWTISGTAMVPLLAELTGDGALDLALGLPDSDDGTGQVELFPGPVTEALTWDSPHIELQGADGVGRELLAADLNGDGAPDLVGEAPSAIWVKPGPIVVDEAFGTANDSRWTWDPAVEVEATVVDFDQDGSEDLLFSTSQEEGDCGGQIRELRLARGPITAGEFALDEAELVFALPAGAMASPWFADAGGDGIADMFLFLNTREIAVYTAPIAPGDEAAWRFSAPGFAFFTGDVNGDGAIDLLQQTWVEDAPLVSFGPLEGLADDMAGTCAFDADEAWTGGAAFPDAGWVGDLDGDASADAIVMATAADGAGAIQLLLGAR